MRDLFVGVDLGQAHDFTAITVAERFSTYKGEADDGLVVFGYNNLLGGGSSFSKRLMKLSNMNSLSVPCHAKAH